MKGLNIFQIYGLDYQFCKAICYLSQCPIIHRENPFRAKYVAGGTNSKTKPYVPIAHYMLSLELWSIVSCRMGSTHRRHMNTVTQHSQSPSLVVQ